MLIRTLIISFPISLFPTGGQVWTAWDDWGAARWSVGPSWSLWGWWQSCSAASSSAGPPTTSCLSGGGLTRQRYIQARLSLHWSSSYITVLSLVETFTVMKLIIRELAQQNADPTNQWEQSLDISLTRSLPRSSTTKCRNCSGPSPVPTTASTRCYIRWWGRNQSELQSFLTEKK